MLEEFQDHLDDTKKNCSESEAKAKSSSKLLEQVNNGIEHLTEKMQHIKAVRKYYTVTLNVVVYMCMLPSMLRVDSMTLDPT